MASQPILEIDNLKTHFFTNRGVVTAVDGSSWKINAGDSLGLVGESGSGKSVSALSIMQLVPKPGKIIDGKILFNGDNLLGKDLTEMRKIRGAKISMSFQDDEGGEDLGVWVQTIVYPANNNASSLESPPPD